MLGDCTENKPACRALQIRSRFVLCHLTLTQPLRAAEVCAHRVRAMYSGSSSGCVKARPSLNLVGLLANVCGLSMFSHQRQGEPPHVAVEPGWRVTVEWHMNRTALAFGIGASLILAAGTANAAGSCGAEVAELQQKIGMEQGANATIGATDPGVQQPSPTASADTSTSTTTSPTSDQVANTDNSANATIGAADPGVQQPAPEANATTGTSTTTDTTTDGSSTTTADNTGANATIGPTDPGVQQPQNTDATADSSGSSTTTTITTEPSSTTADSTTTMPSGDVTETSRVGDMNTSAGGHAEAITALKKAQLAADAGDEATCMTELGTAKAAMGVQ
jgi:hypothetical protein